MDAVLMAASCSRIGFSIYFAIYARRVRVPGGSKFNLEPGTIHRYRRSIYSYNVVSCGQHLTDDLCCNYIFTNINSSNSQ